MRMRAEREMHIHDTQFVAEFLLRSADVFMIAAACRTL
jgi:hypothetical protein